MQSSTSIESLPNEVLINIFGYLSQNELGRIASVNTRFNKCTQCPILWENVDVKFSWYNGSQNKVALNFSEKLPSTVTHIKLNFKSPTWKEKLSFEGFCVKLKERCPHLQTITLQNASFLSSLTSVIDSCTKFLPELKVLRLPLSIFGNDWKQRQQSGTSVIEILDLSDCGNIGRSDFYFFSELTHLKKLSLMGTCARYDWFTNVSSVSFLKQLDVLHLGRTTIGYKTFSRLQVYAVNLSELSLCYTSIEDNDLKLVKSGFPLLKIICIGFCRHITCEGIISLFQSCHSLQKVYVERDIAQRYAQISSIVASSCKFGGVVEAVDLLHDH